MFLADRTHDSSIHRFQSQTQAKIFASQGNSQPVTSKPKPENNVKDMGIHNTMFSPMATGEKI